MLCGRKVMNFFIRKDVRKILKRKDSDAGERGSFLPKPIVFDTHPSSLPSSGARTDSVSFLLVSGGGVSFSAEVWSFLPCHCARLWGWGEGRVCFGSIAAWAMILVSNAATYLIDSSLNAEVFCVPLSMPFAFSVSCKALEDLRASLFSELRTSEGAKRLQQRVCGPTVALSFNFFVSVSIIMMNKLVLDKVGFNYPIFLTFIHYMLSWILMAILNAISLLPASPPPKSTSFSSLLTLGIVMSVSTGLANVSLKYNSVGFYQMAKIAVTPTIVLSEFVLFRKTVSFQKVLALSIVSVGVSVATVTDLQFHFFGACIALAWIIPSAINKILWSNLQQQNNWTALALMWKTTPITLLFLIALMPWLDPPGVLSFNWNIASTSPILMSALLGFLLQLSGALALGATSAISHVVLGQFKTCVILLGGFILFNSNPGILSICGAITALGGMSLYTYLNLLDSRQTHLPFRQTLQKSKLSKESSDADESCIINSV
ncbi:hypothetical protein Taro_011221 [Colocasia esculenta]|uniref:Sugar phosphate transporter domain-containing protein n=1 Tax=Colocasia esculenta TaxID=4460 RepID=A0A843U5H8_COLES|nr:hypothetical protein [Colocasia esculenta]